MLVDVKTEIVDDPIVALVLGNSEGLKREREGVYSNAGFNPHVLVEDGELNENDIIYIGDGELADVERYELWSSESAIPTYGVADNYQQVIDKYSLDTVDVPLVLFITEVRKDEQYESGGWRWHKWGEYIGDQEPTREYLYDEPHIESVVCFRIYRKTLINV